MNDFKKKRMAILGFIGGLLFAIGDWLVYLIPNYHNEEGIYSDWANMSMLSPTFSTYLGCIGSGLLLIGFYSLYCIVKENASKRLKGLMFVLAYGIMLTPIGHFVIACIVPMTYKCAIHAGVSMETAKEIANTWLAYTNPIKLFVMAVVILLQSVVVMILILKGKIKCPRWMIILNPIGLILLSIPAMMVLNGTGLEGITEAFESLGEGCVYFPVYWHWRKQCKNITLLAGKQ